MYAVAPTPESSEEIRRRREKAALVKKLKSFSTRSQVGETRRCAADRRGKKLHDGHHFDDVPTSGRLAITSNLATSLIERKISACTRYEPVPMVSALRSSEDDSAELLEGGLKAIWRHARMQQKIKSSARRASFTRPGLWYVYWDSAALGGKGFVDTQEIPGHRSIIDDRFMFLRDMEFKGFWQKQSRAKLIQLFPNKVDEIEGASEMGPVSPLRPDKSPLRDAEPTQGNAINRLVASNPNGPFVGVQSLKQGGKQKPYDTNYLAEEVIVEYLWIDDPSPTEETRPKKNAAGHQMYHVVRDPKTNEIVFEIEGYDVAHSPLTGAIYQPRLKPKLIEAVENVIVKKYKHLRHIAWIPQDEIILWDVAWNGPCPLISIRDHYGLEGYWVQGMGLRAATLNIARNILLSMMIERIRLGLSGTWLADRKSGLNKNKLVPEVGVVFKVNDINGVKEFPTSPIDAQQFQLLQIIEEEMMKVIGVGAVSQGQAAGRADSPDTYDKLIEQASEPIAEFSQMIEFSVQEWAEVAMWFMQTYFTHEHMVEVEDVDGGTTWRTASALAVRGEFAVEVEVGSMVSMSESAAFARAQAIAGMGIYTLPMVVKMGHIPHGKRALKQKIAIMQNPQLASALMGPSGAPPSTTNQTVRAQGKRSHHAPGSGR